MLKSESEVWIFLLIVKAIFFPHLISDFFFLFFSDSN